MIGTLIFYAIWFVFSAAIFWKLYAKAGQPGWTSLVPGYSSYIMGKITRKPKIGIIVGIASSVIFVSNFIVFLPIGILLIFSIIDVIFGLYLLNSFIKCYDRGIGAWFIYLFLPFIGVFFVDKATYKVVNSPMPAAVNPPTQNDQQPPVQSNQPPTPIV